MKNIDIKKVTPEKVLQLQKIGKQTFVETFALENSEENMKAYLENSFSIKNW